MSQPIGRHFVFIVVTCAAIVTSCGSELPAISIQTDSTTTTTTTTTTTSVVPTTSVTTSTVPQQTTVPGSTAGTTTSVVAPGGTAPRTDAEWRNVTANLAGMESDCGNLTTLAAPPGADEVIAGVAVRGLWTLEEPGADWEPLGVGEGSDAIVNRPTNILFDPDRDGAYWSVGTYHSAGVHFTTDAGTTFDVVGDVPHVDAIGVDFGDPDRQTLLVSIHEQPDVRLSTDGGSTWQSLADNLPPEIGRSNVPFVVSDDTFLLGTWQTDQPGIYRSTDGGQTWQSVFQGYVLELAMPFVLADGSILWVLHNGGGVIRSSDGGATWEQWSFTPLAVPIVEMEDGRLASSTADQVMISDDDGVTWTWVGPAVPFPPASFAYSAGDRTFYISQWDCGQRVLPNAVASLTLTGD